MIKFWINFDRKKVRVHSVECGTELRKILAMLANIFADGRKKISASWSINSKKWAPTGFSALDSFFLPLYFVYVLQTRLEACEWILCYTEAYWYAYTIQWSMNELNSNVIIWRIDWMNSHVLQSLNWWELFEWIDHFCKWRRPIELSSAPLNLLTISSFWRKSPEQILENLERAWNPAEQSTLSFCINPIVHLICYWCSITRR